MLKVNAGRILARGKNTLWLAFVILLGMFAVLPSTAQAAVVDKVTAGQQFGLFITAQRYDFCPSYTGDTCNIVLQNPCSVGSVTTTAPFTISQDTSYGSFTNVKIVGSPTLAQVGSYSYTLNWAAGPDALTPSQCSSQTYDIDVVPPPPTVTQITPQKGGTAGGVFVTITGSNFVSGSTSVNFGSNAATNVDVIDSNTLTANAPAGTGTVTVTVTTTGGTSTDAVSFKYLQAPSITAAWSPTTIPANGSTTSTLTLTMSNPNGEALPDVAVAPSPLPAGLTLDVNSLVLSCNGDIFPPGVNNMLAAGNVEIPANSSCTFKADVKTTSAGTFSFTSGQVLSASGGSGGTATTPTSLTATAAAQSVEVSSGSGQSASINTAFANDLVALVKDYAGDPMSGVTVTFTAPNSGASATFNSTTAQTNAQGLASVTATANGTAGGPYNVSAAVSGIATPATFSLSNGKQSQTVNFTSTPPLNPKVGDPPYTVSADATSGLTVSIDVHPFSAGICSISGNQVSFLSPGKCVIVASQAGNDTYSEASANQGMGVEANDVGPTAEAEGGYISTRATLIIGAQFDGGGQIDRMLQAGQQNGGSSGQLAEGSIPAGMPTAASSSRLGGSVAGFTGQNGNGNVSDIFGLQSLLTSFMSSASEDGSVPTRFHYEGPATVDADFSDGVEGSFHASLNQMLGWQQKQEAALGVGSSSIDAYSPFDLWIEGTYSSFDGNSDGHFGLVTVGADYVLNPSFLAGFYAQYDTSDQSSTADLNGKGWMAGPYATARLAENVFWQGRAAWGQSSNDIDTGTATGSFDTTRWLVYSELSGRWALGNGLMLSPIASFTYFEDSADSYVDSLGNTIPEVTSKVGQVRLAPKLAYGFATADGVWIEPSLSPELLWNFTSTKADGLGSLDGDATGPEGLRGRVRTGLTVRTPGGVNISAEGSYDGIGMSSEYHAITGRLGLALQF